MTLNQLDVPPPAPEPLLPPTFAPRLPPAPARRPAPEPVSNPVLPAASMYAAQRAVTAPFAASAPSSVRTTAQPVGQQKRAGGRRALSAFVWLVAAGAIGAGCVVGYRHASEQTAAGVAAVSSDAPVLPDLTFTATTPRVVSYVRTTRTIGVVDGSTIASNAVLKAEVDYVTPIASVDLNMATAGEHEQMHLILTPDSAYRDGTADGGMWERLPRASRLDQAADSPELLRAYQDVVTDDMRDAAKHVSVRHDIVDVVPITTYEFDIPLALLADESLLPAPVDMATAEKLLKPELTDVHIILAIDDKGLVRLEDMQANESSWRDALKLLPEEFPMLVHDRFEVTSTSETPSATTVPASFVDAIDAEPGTLNELCETERRTLEVAVEAWYAMNGEGTVPTEQQLIDEEFLLTDVAGYDITPEGDVVAAPGSPCV